MQHRYIAIEGNIGAGKTTLATMLSEHFGARLILEQFEENPFLPGFYQDPAKHAFALELSFLAERYSQMKNELAQHDMFQPVIVSDYFIQKSLLFAKNNLKEEEFTLFSKLFHIMHASLPKPDLLVYLHLDVPELLDNIDERGREFEENITEEYLHQIQNNYLHFISRQQNMPVILLDINHLDFVENKEDFQRIVSLVSEKHQTGMKRVSVLE